MVLELAKVEQQIKRLPQKKLATIIVVLAVIYCGFLGAKVFWLLMEQPQSNSVLPTASSTNKDDLRADVGAIRRALLFGDAKAVEQVAPQQEVISDAPETRLSINLTGVVAATDNNQLGLAIIESQGRQETYAVDDVIKGTRAKLAKVLPDRAILDVSGRFETLMLDGMNFTKTVSMPVPASKQPNQNTGPQANQLKQTVNATSNPELKNALKETRQQVLADPGKISEYIRVQPVRNNGQLEGYRLSPGKDPALFKQMGLQNNDIAVSINGYQLSDLKQAMSAMQELRNSTDASITVNRNGQLIDVQFSLQ